MSHQRDRRTRDTGRQQRTLLRIASRGKNELLQEFKLQFKKLLVVLLDSN